jgi:hypothetical protein
MRSNTDVATLKARFCALVDKATSGSASASDLDLEAIWSGLQSSYTDLRRAYHTLTHISAIWEVLSAMPWGSQTNAEHAFEQIPVHVGLAAWWHDAVYDAQVSDVALTQLPVMPCSSCTSCLLTAIIVSSPID